MPEQDITLPPLVSVFWYTNAYRYIFKKKNFRKNLLDSEKLRRDPATKLICINFSAFGIDPNGRKGLLFKSDLRLVVRM